MTYVSAVAIKEILIPLIQGDSLIIPMDSTILVNPEKMIGMWNAYKFDICIDEYRILT